MPEINHRWLMLRLEAPLMAFGGVTIDQVGVTRDFPAASMLTGFLANALGLKRTEAQAHQRLQDRLVFAACRADLAGNILTDMQNAKLEKSDKGWTTRGTVEGRDGDSYKTPHRRKRDYHMDATLHVAMRLAPVDEAPDLERMADALARPARPLFIGRKPCLPSRPVAERFIEARDAHAALASHLSGPETRMRAIWPAEDGPIDGPDVERIIELADIRNWITGLHGGTRRVAQGWIGGAARQPA